jgi:hypothetical protein
MKRDTSKVKEQPFTKNNWTSEYLSKKKKTESDNKFRILENAIYARGNVLITVTKPWL